MKFSIALPTLIALLWVAEPPMAQGIGKPPLHATPVLTIVAAEPVSGTQSAGAGQQQKKAPPKKAGTPAQGVKKATAVEEREPVVGRTPSGAPVYEGNRGGHYYYTSRGTRQYLKEFIGAKIKGRTEKGYIIYQGPRGGVFYYDGAGEKRYVTPSK